MQKVTLWITASLLFALLLISWGLSQAQDQTPARERPYFYFDAEKQKDGDWLPQPPFFPAPWKEADTFHPKRGKVVADPTAPQGKNVFLWDVAEAKTKELYHEVRFDRLPEAKSKDYYYAFFVRFDRKGGKDIWHDGDGDSFDKGFEVIGDGIRWVIHFGNHAVRMKDHRFSCYLSNSTYHLNPKLEVYDGFYPNYGGFSQYTSPELEYEKWHAIVFQMKWATDDTGEIGLWVNGTKVLQHQGIKTAKAPGTFERLQFFGTIAQPAYDAPPHVRKVDALIFTDNWQDIVDGGYLERLKVKGE
jgi:hypothetical protein